MKKFLAFEAGGFRFLQDVADVVEVFDAAASPEEIGQVLVSNAVSGDAVTEVYWRGQRGSLLSMNRLLQVDRPLVPCFVVCRNAQPGQPLYLLQVDAIVALLEIDEGAIQRLQINHPRLRSIVDSIFLDAVTGNVSFLPGEIGRLFSASAPVTAVGASGTA